MLQNKMDQLVFPGFDMYDKVCGEKVFGLVCEYLKEKDDKKKEGLKERIVQQNEGLIKKCVASNTKNPDEFDDIYQSAFLGFLEGLDKFDPKRKRKFSTYIIFWIRKGIYRYFYDRNILYIPRSEFNKKGEFKDNLKQYYNHRLMDIGGEAFQENIISPIYNQDHGIIIDGSTLKILKMVVREELKGPEKRVIKMKFLNKDPKTVREISEQLNVSMEQVRILEKRAFIKLKGKYNEYGLKFSDCI